MTVDLPTPPLPLVTAITRVSESGPNGITRAPAAAEALGERLTLVGRHDADVECDLGDAGNGGRGIRHLAADPLGRGAADDREERCRPMRRRAVDRDRADHAEVVEGAAQLRIDHGPDGGAHRLGRRRSPSLGLGGGLRPRGTRLELLEERLQLRPQHVAGHDLVGVLRDGHAQGDDLAGEVLGVGEVALGALAILLDLHAVAVVLAVLRQQDEGRGIRRLQRQDQRQQA